MSLEHASFTVIQHILLYTVHTFITDIGDMLSVPIPHTGISICASLTTTLILGFPHFPQHVFCEDCLCLWFERERTCPLCRSTVVEAPRCWKDGTTSAHFQVYWAALWRWRGWPFKCPLRWLIVVLVWQIITASSSWPGCPLVLCSVLYFLLCLCSCLSYCTFCLKIF